MRNGFLGSLFTLLACAGAASAQSFPSFQAAPPPGYGPPPAGFYNPYYGVAPQQPPRMPAWPGSAPQGAYGMPYGAPMMPGYGPPMGANPGYPSYPGLAPQMPPSWPRTMVPTAAPAPAPQATASDLPGVPVTPPSAPQQGQPLMKLGEAGPLPPADLPVVAPRPGTQLLQDDDPEACPSCAAPPKILSHEKNPPFAAPPGYCLYGMVQGLAWWTRGQNTVPLLSTGALPGGTVLADNLNFNNQPQYGSLVTLGTWLDRQQRMGLEVTGFWLPNQKSSLTVQSPGTTTFGNPFSDANTGLEGFQPLASPGLLAGTARILTNSELYGGEANLRFELCRTCNMHLDLLTGFRYLDLREGLEIEESSTFTPQVPILAGTTLNSSDRFRTHNQFYGGQLGLESEWHWGRFFVDVWGKVALGANDENVSIGGTTVLNGNTGLSLTRNGGFYTQPTNIGSYERTQFAVIPAFGLQAGYQLTTHLRASFGYSFLYLNQAVRPGDQIDRTVNLTQQGGALVGPARPAFNFVNNEYWAQGINIGLEFRY